MRAASNTASSEKPIAAIADAAIDDPCFDPFAALDLPGAGAARGAAYKAHRRQSGHYASNGRDAPAKVEHF